MTAKTFHGFLVRILTLALALVGAMLLPMGLVGDAEAQATVHAEVRVVHEPDTRPAVPPYDLPRLIGQFGVSMFLDALKCPYGFNPNDLSCNSSSNDPGPDFLDGGEGEYPADLCARLGGDVKLVGGQKVCQNIDTDGTFCFMGAPEVFPCRGLYKRVTHCNHFNRPGENPFTCGRACPQEEGEEQFACGGKCWSGEIDPMLRIPYVAPGHVGDVFQVAATLRAGEARFSLSSSIFTVGAADGTLATVRISAPLAAGAEYAATLRADFACNGLSNTPAHAEWAFTVTALAAVQPATVYLEGGEGTGAGTVTISGIGQLSFAATDPVLAIGESGKISVKDQRPTVGAELTFRVRVTSPEVAGAITLTVVVKFRHPFDSDLGASHCSVPDDSDYQALRQAACSDDAVDDYCAELDDDLLDALETDGDKGDSDFCSALRNGADVNALDSNGDYPLGLAAEMGRVDLGERLTMHGASLSNNESELGNPINHAARAGSAEFMRWLLATVGVDVDEKSGSGNEYAPVHILGMLKLGDDSVDSEAVTAVARLLTLYNANLDAKSPFAADDDSPLLPYRYIDHLTDPGDPPDHRPLRIFLEAGMDVSAPHYDEYVPIARAVQNNHTLVLSVLLDYDDDADRVSPADQTTPLFHARSPEAVSLLHDAGADLNAYVAISGTVFQTPLDVMIAALVASPDENLRLAVSLLAKLGGNCLATLSDSEKKSHCRNTSIVEDAKCEDTGGSPDPSGEYTFICTLTCAVGNDTEWDCPVSADDYLNHTLEEIEDDCKGHPDAASACFL